MKTERNRSYFTVHSVDRIGTIVPGRFYISLFLRHSLSGEAPNKRKPLCRRLRRMMKLSLQARTVAAKQFIEQHEQDIRSLVDENVDAVVRMGALQHFRRILSAGNPLSFL